MTVSKLRNELTDEELIYFAAYYDLKADREEAELQKARRK